MNTDWLNYPATAGQETDFLRNIGFTEAQITGGELFAFQLMRAEYGFKPATRFLRYRATWEIPNPVGLRAYAKCLYCSTPIEFDLINAFGRCTCESCAKSSPVTFLVWMSEPTPEDALERLAYEFDPELATPPKEDYTCPF